MRRILILLSAVAALTVPATAAAAGVGINVPDGAASYGQATATAATGATTARVFVVYDGGAPAVNDYRRVVDAFNAVGVRPMLVVTGHSAPADADHFASYMGTLAKALGSRVAAWEIWNEPDGAEYWGAPGGDPAAYASLLRKVYPQVAPYAKVLSGGLVGNDYGFLSAVYDALGGSSAGAFDAVAVHTDTACSIVGPDDFFRDSNGMISRWSFLGLRSVHDVMAAHGDAAKPIWITELGWNTSTGACDSGMWAGQKAAGVSPDDQARFLTQAWHCLKDYPYVENALWFNLRDSGSTSAHQYGIVGKPAFGAFQRVAGGADDMAGQPCGDFGGPAISVAAPTAGARFRGPLRITATATDDSGVGRITLLADGKKIRNFTTGLRDAKQWPATLDATINWMGAKKLTPGPHTITILAIDSSRNQTTTTVAVTKLAAKPKKHKSKRHRSTRRKRHNRTHRRR